MIRRVLWWLDEPTHALRVEIMRIGAPLAVLGFAAGRIVHADEWIGDAGFRVPDLGGDWRQPLYIPALPSWAAWAVAAAMVVSGLACCLGIRTRPSALLFAATLVFVDLSDRLETYTVTKLSPAILVALALAPAGERLGVDAYLKAKKGAPASDAYAVSGPVRFLQVLVVVIYSASGIAKARGDWLREPLVLWSHLHDSYQTAVSFALASVLPGWSWTALQGVVLAFELLAPVWFGLGATRTWALAFGLSMHVMIGLLFGPVRWLALLMMTLLVGGFLPDTGLAWLDGVTTRVVVAARSRAVRAAPSR